MDLTQEYIKMCKKTDEIQLLAPYHNTLKDFYTEDDFVWLPRQDQLQAILNYKSNWELVEDFHESMEEDLGGVLGYFADGANPSLEICWLVFYMRKSFNKTWDGEEWIEKKS